jgi:hypothetical protein
MTAVDHEMTPLRRGRVGQHWARARKRRPRARRQARRQWHHGELSGRERSLVFVRVDCCGRINRDTSNSCVQVLFRVFQDSIGFVLLRNPPGRVNTKQTHIKRK